MHLPRKRGRDGRRLREGPPEETGCIRKGGTAAVSKIRIYELAKETGADTQDIIRFLGGDLKPASGIDEETALRVRKKFAAPAAKEEK
ncbi:MAG: translation initiation factor IF-2 N-terminal domain-containing protein, partial [Lachnospiraceae bacterium]|nr:translation initiation factor IF-2 N-terminal domain-containing protein [Lachnospiraceae bacterium]